MEIPPNKVKRYLRRYYTLPQIPPVSQLNRRKISRPAGAERDISNTTDWFSLSG